MRRGIPAIALNFYFPSSPLSNPLLILSSPFRLAIPYLWYSTIFHSISISHRVSLGLSFISVTGHAGVRTSVRDHLHDRGEQLHHSRGGVSLPLRVPLSRVLRCSWAEDRWSVRVALGFIKTCPENTSGRKCNSSLRRVRLRRLWALPLKAGEVASRRSPRDSIRESGCDAYTSRVSAEQH